MLVQSKRDKHATLKLMRKLLKKYAFVPERLVTDDLRSYAPAASDLGIEHLHECSRCRTVGPRTHINRPDGGRARCSFKSACSAQKLLSAHTAVHNTFTVKCFSPQFNHIACSAPRRLARGGRPSRPHEDP